MNILRLTLIESGYYKELIEEDEELEEGIVGTASRAGSGVVKQRMWHPAGVYMKRTASGRGKQYVTRSIQTPTQKVFSQ